jgi:hypothetical protein
LGERWAGLGKRIRDAKKKVSAQPPAEIITRFCSAPCEGMEILRLLSMNRAAQMKSTALLPITLLAPGPLK